MTNEKEQIIIKNVVAGDVRAFTSLVDKYKDMAIVLAFNIVLNQEDAEEVAQDAFVKAYTSLHLFKADSRFSTWLYRIIINTALNKKKLKKHHLVEINESLSEVLPSGINNIMTAHVSADQRKVIQFALQSLNENERLCITLFYLNEVSVEEIHELTGLSNANIKVLLFRGRKNLYTSLKNCLGIELKELINV